MPDSCFSKWKDEEELDIARFYKVSELERTDVIKWCSEVGISEDEFLKTQSTTIKYTWQNLFYTIYELFSLKDFQRLMAVFFVGFVFILIFVK